MKKLTYNQFWKLCGNRGTEAKQYLQVYLHKTIKIHYNVHIIPVGDKRLSTTFNLVQMVHGFIFENLGSD